MRKSVTVLEGGLYYIDSHVGDEAVSVRVTREGRSAVVQGPVSVELEAGDEVEAWWGDEDLHRLFSVGPHFEVEDTYYAGLG